MQYPQIKIHRNPFNFHDDETFYIEPNTRLIDFLQEKWPTGFSKKVNIYYNGKLLCVDDYDIELGLGDIVYLQYIPEAPAVLVEHFLIAAAVYVGTTLLADSLLPSIEVPDNLSSLKDAGGSAYNLREQKNVIRLGEPIPTQYGKFNWYPDLACVPWMEYIDNERYLNQLFCLGWGEFDIHNIKLGEGDLNTFTGIEYEVYGPNEEVTFFEAGTTRLTGSYLTEEAHYIYEYADNIYTVPGVSDIKIYHLYYYNRKDNYIKIDFTNSDNEIIYSDSSITNDGHALFQEVFEVGDTVLLRNSGTGSNTSFNGEYVITEVETDRLEISSPTYIQELAASSSITVELYNKKRIKYINFGYTDLDYPTDYASRKIVDGATEGHVICPVSTVTDTLYLDLEFEQGLYLLSDTDPYDLEYDTHSVSLKILFRQLDSSGNFAYTLKTATTQSMTSSDNLTFRPTDYIQRYWNSEYTLTFYSNGTAISSSDIQTIDYGGDFGGAYVKFKTSKTGTITYTGKYNEPMEKTITFSISDNSPFSFRKSICIYLPAYDIPAGVYKIWFYRSNGQTWFESNYVDTVTLRGIRSYLTRVGRFGPYSMLAVRMKETESLTGQTSKKINVICTRKLPTYNGTSWNSPTSTRSIAWAFADIWMSTYGASRSHTNLDLDKLIELDTLWEARGDTFDGVFDSQITVWEALTKVARAGRAKPVFDGTTLTMVRDGEKSIYTAAYGVNNILKDTFNVEYQFPDEQSVDGVIIKYVDENNNYTPSTIQPSVSLNKGREIDFFGVVNYEQAYREALFLDAQVKNQKIKITFETELAGHIPFYGDLISVQNDIPNWGQGGFIVGKDGTTLTTTEPIDWTGTGNFYISFIKPNGGLSGPHLVTQGEDEYTVILDTDVTDFTFITTLDSKIPTAYQFGLSSSWNKPCIVTKISPKDNNNSVKIECVPYSDDVYQADTITIPEYTGLDVTQSVKTPKISGLVLTNSLGSGVVNVVWNSQYYIDNYILQKSTDNITWTTVSSPTVALASINATGALYVQVACVIDGNVGEYTKASILAS